FLQAEDGIRGFHVTGVQTCALPILARIVEDTMKKDGRRVLAALIRLTGDFDAAEDALQEAYVRALATWKRDGVPSNPGAWLNTEIGRASGREREQNGGVSVSATQHN